MQKIYPAKEVTMHQGAPPRLFGFAKTNRHTPTQAEEVLWNALKNKQLGGYKFRRQHPVGAAEQLPSHYFATFFLNFAPNQQPAQIMHLKHLIPSLAALLFCFGCSIGKNSAPVTSGNPIFQGWYADPELRIFDEKVWIFPTFSAKYEQQVYFDAFSSTDLVTWEKHAHILDTAAVKWAKRAMWAPSVVEKEGKYYYFFGANDIQSNAERGGIGVAVSDSPAGPFKDYLGKPLVDKFYNGAQPIDQFVFKDLDGRFYLIYGGWGHCNIARLKADFTGFEPHPDGTLFKEITPEGYVEGSFMFVRNGKYYFMWSEGGWTGPDYSVAYAMSDSPMGPFKRIGKILQQDPKIATGAGHHSVLQLPGKDTWYIVYHRRPLTETDGNARQVCIEHLYFDKSGLIKPVVLSIKGVERVSGRFKR